MKNCGWAFWPWVYCVPLACGCIGLGSKGRTPKAVRHIQQQPHRPSARLRPQAHSLNANATHNVRSLQTLQCPTKKKPCVRFYPTPHLAGCAVRSHPTSPQPKSMVLSPTPVCIPQKTKPSRYPWALKREWCAALTAPYQPPTHPTPSDAVQEAPADGEHPVDVLKTRPITSRQNLRRLQTMQQNSMISGNTCWENRRAMPIQVKKAAVPLWRGESEQVSVPIKVIDTEGNPLEGATVSPSRSGFYTGEQFADKTNAQGMTSLRAPADEPLFLTAKYRWVSGFNRHVIVIPSQISVALITLDLEEEDTFPSTSLHSYSKRTSKNGIHTR